VAALRRKLVIGILLVAALSFTGGILVWRYTYRRRGAAPYLSLPADAVQMADRRRTLAGGGDSDEEPDERTGLTSESPHRLGIHSGFLDDDEDDEYPPSGRGSPAYRDEPSGTEARDHSP